MKYVSNGFSPKMLNPNKQLYFTMETTTYDEIQENKDELISSIGHENIANHLGIEKNRINIILEAGDIIYLVSCKDSLDEYSYRKITIENN
jgi:DNA-directed RNA polymerase specialized sigma subunit